MPPQKEKGPKEREWVRFMASCTLPSHASLDMVHGTCRPQQHPPPLRHTVPGNCCGGRAVLAAAQLTAFLNVYKAASKRYGCAPDKSLLEDVEAKLLDFKPLEKVAAACRPMHASICAACTCMRRCTVFVLSLRAKHPQPNCLLHCRLATSLPASLPV